MPDRRTFLIAALRASGGMAGSVFLAACAPTAPSTPTTPPAPVPTVAAAPAPTSAPAVASGVKRGGVIVTADFDDPGSMDPAQITNSTGRRVARAIYDPLVELDQANNVKYTGMWASGDNYANLNPGSLFAVSPGWRVFPNNDGFKEPRWAELVAASNTEVDPAKQKQLYSDINDYVLDQCFTYAVSNNPVWWVTSAKFHGLFPTLHQGFLWTDAYFYA